MYGNSFKGIVLVSLSSLKSIEELDLSSNNLSGQLPRLLVNLSFLVLLNLSYNHFDGEVPTKGVFNNKTRISLAGNGKLCGGSDDCIYHPATLKIKKSHSTQTGDFGDNIMFDWSFSKKEICT